MFTEDRTNLEEGGNSDPSVLMLTLTLLSICCTRVVKKRRILFALTSSEKTRHHCGLQTSGSPKSCSGGSKRRSSLLINPSDWSRLLLDRTHLVMLGCSPGVVFLREVSQIVIVVKVEARHQLLVHHRLISKRHTVKIDR